MKTIVNISFICLWFFLQMQLYGQDDPPTAQNSYSAKFGTAPTNQKTVGADDHSGTGIHSSVHGMWKEASLFFNDWSPATVVLKDKSIITDRMVRYDVYHRQMQFAFNGDTAAFGKPVEIESIMFEQNTFVYEDLLCKTGARKDYMEVIADGPCRLLLYRCITYKYVEDCTIPGAENPKTEYYQTNKYLVSKNNQAAIPVPEKKSEVIDLFSDTGKDIKTFLLKNKIKLNNEEDLIKLVYYYNEN